MERANQCLERERERDGEGERELTKDLIACSNHFSRARVRPWQEGGGEMGQSEARVPAGLRGRSLNQGDDLLLRVGYVVAATTFRFCRLARGLLPRGARRWFFPRGFGEVWAREIP